MLTGVVVDGLVGNRVVYSILKNMIFSYEFDFVLYKQILIRGIIPRIHTITPTIKIVIFIQGVRLNTCMELPDRI
jgi:hypothetical protein